MNCCCYQCASEKGQILSVRVPEGNHGVLQLQRVLFAPIFTSCRRDGRIVIGATSEEVGLPKHPSWHSSLTGTSHQALSTIQHYPIQELWWGSVQRRQMSYPFLALAQNLTLATGHHRNGILLAPVTAALIADLIWEQSQTPYSFQLLTVLLTKSRRQETGDRGQETGDGRQETGDGRRETGDGRQGGLPAPLLPCSPSPLLPISPAPPISPLPISPISPSPQSLPTHSPHPKCKQIVPWAIP